MKNSGAKIGDYVALPGAGGGLGHLAIQYANAMGLRVIAIDSGEEKKKLCLSLGAEHWIDFKESKDLVADIKAASGGFGPHAAIVTAASVSFLVYDIICLAHCLSQPSAYQQAVDYLRPSGTLVLVGLPVTNIGANVFWTVFKVSLRSPVLSELPLTLP